MERRVFERWLNLKSFDLLRVFQQFTERKDQLGSHFLSYPNQRNQILLIPRIRRFQPMQFQFSFVFQLINRFIQCLQAIKEL